MIKEVGYLGTFSRPDASGRRGGMSQYPKVQKGDDFPYDMPVNYGQAGGKYVKGDGTSGPSYHGITPKNTEHSAWEEIEEILGSPILLAKGAQQTATTPGATGGWAGSPAKPWDENDKEDELEFYGESIWESLSRKMKEY